MNKTSFSPATNLLVPPVSRYVFPTSNWFSLLDTDPITHHLAANLWDREENPESWQAARLSQAAYIYREQTTGWAIVAKFHTTKTGADAERHAAQEHLHILRALEVGTSNDTRAVRSLGFWRGVIFLEYVGGLTLEDKIAIRRNQPGELIRILECTGRYLASLHSRNLQPKSAPDFSQAAELDALVIYLQKLSGMGALPTETQPE